MTKDSYYVYALKDPRNSPALPFYIGKGTGIRAWDHVNRADKTRKGKRIAAIHKQGFDVIVTVLSDGLSEIQAFKLEAELIAAFGTEDSGGILTNSVLPSGTTSKASKSVVVPSGVQERAQLGLTLLKEAVIELGKANPKGVTNADVTRALALQSDYGGGSRDYLAWSILGMLMREGKIKRPPNSRLHVIQVR